MLTTTRREIVNDYEVSQDRQVRNFADYTFEEMTESRFENKMEARPLENYMSRSEIAQRLYGREYNEFYEEEHNDENYSDPDLMPTNTTMQITRRASVQPTQSQTQSATKQSYTAKSKILIASYAAVLLALALIFTLTIVSIGSLFATTSEVEVKVQQQYASVESQAPASAYVYDADANEVFVK